MYIGRFLVVAPDWAAYRVSSRSFPNREIIEREEALAVVPTDAAEPTDNPYISYHCLRMTSEGATIGNGAHVDPIAEKLALGYPPRDALVTGLHAMDFEKDAYDTPRIAGIISNEASYIGIVRRDVLLVREVEAPKLVATYELQDPTSFDGAWDSAAAAARGVYELEYDHPVCAAAVQRSGDAFETGFYNDRDPA